MAWGPSVELEFIEKTPFEIPPLQKIQPTKDFSFKYKVGEFAEEVESITYEDIKDNSELTFKELFNKRVPKEIKYISGRTRGKYKTTYVYKILEVKENGDYLLSKSWTGKEKYDCAIPNLVEYWSDKNSNHLESKKNIYNCKEYKSKPENDLKDPKIKYDNLTLHMPIFSESKNEKYKAKLENQFIGISNYKNRKVALITQKSEIETNRCMPDNFLFGKNHPCSWESYELIYIDLKLKVPLLKKTFNKFAVGIGGNSFSIPAILGLFPFIMQTQSIHAYTYPSGYLQ